MATGVTSARETESPARRLTAVLRLVLLAVALGLATLGYRDHFVPQSPWWRWLTEVIGGCVALTFAFADAPTPAEAPMRRLLRWTAGAVALLALAALIVLFPQPGRELAAGVAAIVAVKAFFVARWVPFAHDDVVNLSGDDAVAATRWSAWRWSLAGVAVAANVAAIAVNPTQHLAAFLLWLASLALLAVATWYRAAQPIATDNTWRRTGGPELSPRAAALALLLILTLALGLRVMALHDAPAAIDPDEGRQGRSAERIWKDGFPDAFGLGWNVFPHLSYMVEYSGVQLRGTSNASLRFSAAMVGVLSLVPVFFWARRWWGNMIALLAVALLAINRDHLAFSRVALNNIQQVLVAALVLAAFARLLRTRRALDWVWFGYAVGLGFHTYHAAKLFPALLAIAAVLFAIGMRGFWRRYLGGALVGALAFLLCTGPLLVTMYRRWGEFYGGTSNRFDTAQLVDAYQRGDSAGVRSYLGSHVGGCLLSFISVPSMSPVLDGFVAVLFLLGVGWMAWRWRDPRHVVVVIWLFGILVIGGMVTDYPPWKPRLIGMLPVVCLIPALTIGRMRAALFEWSPRWADVIGVPLLLVWFIAALHANWVNFFVDLPNLQRGDIMTEICNAIDDTPTPATFYMVGGAVMAEPKVASNDCMIAPNPERTLIDLPDDPHVVPIAPSNRGTAVLLVSWMQQELVPLIFHYYPDAQYELIHEQHGYPVLHKFTLRGDVIERRRGLRATYRSANRTWSAPDGVDVAQSPPDATPADFPLDVTWRGQIWIATPGPYAFRAGAAPLRLDGRPTSAESPRDLAAGWHTIELQARFANPTERIALDWRTGESPWAAAPHASLHTHPDTHGLLGRYFTHEITATPITAAPDYSRIDPAVSFDFYQQFDEPPVTGFATRPSTMQWTGTVELPEGGAQALRIEATGPTEVFLNGNRAASAPGRDDAQGVTVELGNLTGRVPILVRSMRSATAIEQFWKLRLLWRTPSGAWSAFADYRPE
ncbi:MAG: glycosyltransferase family 39 protein [Deltaproteobacteria bacterium]|nr:glycosyltransferase family 39 protein [Deltaproteobacteria bacterium]